MERRPFLGLLGAAAVAPLPAWSQSPERMSKIGILIGVGSDASDFAVSVFRDALRKRGYVEGRNVSYHLHIDTGGTDASLTRAVAQLVAAGPDVVLAANTPPVAALHQAAPALPIVMVAVGDPVGAGFIKSRARPGGVITGLIGLDAELTGRRLELIREVLPDVKRVGLLTSPDNPVLATQMLNAEAVARVHGIELLREDVHGVSDLERAFAAVAGRGGGAALRLGGFRTRAAILQMADLTIKHRLPFCSDRVGEVQAGLLMSYGPNTAEAFRQAAGYVDNILRGDNPAELPVQSPTRFELALNNNTAQALRITFPAELVARANSIIKI